MNPSRFAFEPDEHEGPLLAIIEEIRRLDRLGSDDYQSIVRRHPKIGGGAYSKSEVIRGFRHFARQQGWQKEESEFVSRIRMKPVRTASGVAPVTVLTRPHPCPGKCIFCPSDVRMPKSYLSREPGAQRAAQHDFDPYFQTFGRLLTFYHNGHLVDKIEMIVLGGTWSFYPESYQIWFIRRCFDAMNDFRAATADQMPEEPERHLVFGEMEEEVDGASMDRTYNQVVSTHLRHLLENRLEDPQETASWQGLLKAQVENETAEARCVGLVIETRPDHLDEAEVERLRRLGCTKIQIGIQSMSDEVLAANHRGHDTAATRRALGLLRQGGFKLHTHWMPNLHGSHPDADIEDFARVFDDPGVRPDELKIYPCSLIDTAELMQYYEAGKWRPYEEDELLRVLSACLLRTPEYCRVTRMIRDIPGDDIHAGNKVTNFREVVERHLRQQGLASRDIRAREIRDRPVDADRLRLERVRYDTEVSDESFLQYVTDDGYIVGFCRLSLPKQPVFIDEIRASAMIREVHVYGVVVRIGGRGGDVGRGKSQHLGLGSRLLEAAAWLSEQAGFADLAVISAVGTREYYRGLGFRDGELYQHRTLSAESVTKPHLGQESVE